MVVTCPRSHWLLLLVQAPFFAVAPDPRSLLSTDSLMVARPVTLSDSSTGDLSAETVRANLVPKYSRKDPLLKKQWVVWVNSALARMKLLEACQKPILLPAQWLLEQARFNMDHDLSLIHI